ncbi:MAG TPA: hypothetical protein VFV49_12045, partial [Thermoanaerobaculia bacterium]|nr:hypothetical protein [Thermoanaerobaculia bacterium]
ADLTAEWSRRLEIGGRGVLVTSLDATADGGVVVAGAAFVMKLDAKGQTQWTVALSAADPAIRTIEQTKDGGYICSGASATLPWLVKLSNTGALEWQRTYGSTAGAFRSVIEARSGGFVAVGVAKTQGVVARVDETGKPAWSRMTTIGFPGHAIAETSAGYVAAFFAGMEIKVAAMTREGAIRWQHIVTEPNVIEDQNGSITRMFAPAADGVVFSFPFESDAAPETGPRLYKMDDAGETKCEATYRSSTVLVPVTLSTTAGTVKLTTIAGKTTKLETTTAALAASAVAETCHWDDPGTPAESSFTPRDPERVSENAKRYRAFLEARDYSALEKIAVELRRPRLGDPMRPHDDLRLFYAAFSTPSSSEEALFASLRDWQAAQPFSITPLVALAHAYHRAAWNRRGGDYSDSVTDLGENEFRRMLDETAAILKKLDGRGDPDPHYWVLRITVSGEGGGEDMLEIARRALRLHPDPEIAWAAGRLLLPRWGGSPADVVAFADEAARLTQKTHGDAIYTWFVQQVAASAVSGDENFEDYQFDWPRARKGGRDAIAMAPEWISSWHRLASLAEMFKDYETSAELFSRKELAWFDDATFIWRDSSRYQDAKERAQPKAKATVIPAPAGAPPAAPSPSRPAPLPSPSVASPKVDPASWPEMLLQTRLTYGGVTHRPVAFVVQTFFGMVGVSAVPAWENRGDSDNVLARLRGQFESWTMYAATKPDREVAIASLMPGEAPPPQLGVCLIIQSTSTAKLLPKSLQIRRVNSIGDIGSIVFVVGCTWEGNRCRQTVFQGTVSGMHTTPLHALRTLDIAVVEELSPENFSGGPVLDANGDVIAVATSRKAGTRSGYKTFISADFLDTVVPNGPPAQ